MTGKVTRTIHRGDVFRYDMAGAGGWGDPLEREPESVLKDVRNEYVSRKAARDEYGVVIDTRSWSVDEDQTSVLREELRRERNWGEAPFIDRGPLPPGAQ
jgi:N-methylhydantoinase B/oxoprolinase/acetone carboxylase alpha subunit